MRTLILILLLVAGFGSAALWQQMRTQKLREERALASQIEAGNIAQTPSGILGKDEAVVVIGRPAGTSAKAATADVKGRTDAPPVVVAPPAVVVPSPPQGDFVLEVSAGQTLSKIAHDHYGHAPLELVGKLAQYNGLADADALRAGMQIKLPTLERLGVTLKN